MKVKIVIGCGIACKGDLTAQGGHREASNTSRVQGQMKDILLEAPQNVALSCR